jgi:hypothetical protein
MKVYASGFAASASKTVNAPVAALYRAVEARVRQEKNAEIRKATAPKSLRIAWKDGTRVDINFYAKGDAKSLAAVQHEKLKDESMRT